MKLTESNNAKNAKFFRDADEGKLLSEKESWDVTEKVIDELPIETSYIGRILLKPKHPKSKQRSTKNSFDSFIDNLVIENKLIDLTQIPKLEDNSKIDEFIKKNISYFGRTLRSSTNSPTLHELLHKHYNGEDVSQEFQRLKEHIGELIRFKRKKLKKSIKNNRIPFKIDNVNKQIVCKTAKMKWLFSFLPNQPGQLNQAKLDNYSKQFDYPTLEYKIVQTIREHDWKKADRIKSKKQRTNHHLRLTKKVYDLVLEHNQNIYASILSKEKQNENLFYLNEVRDHFRRYFPVKNKNDAGSNRLWHFSEKSALYYCSKAFAFQQVHGSIINQLVSGLILCGKLEHYCLPNPEAENTEDKKPQRIYTLDSDGLMQIQIEEAFKKQMFLSLAWAGTRLSYFFNYGGHNAAMLNRNQLESGQCFKGDILTDEKYRKNFTKQLEQHADKEKNSVPLEKKIEIQHLRGKITTSFPLQDTDRDQVAICLLKDCVNSVDYLRNDIFHYRKFNLFDLLKKNKLETGIAKSFLQRDIENIQENFKERIRSTSLAEYYSFDLLQSILQKLKFSLYTPPFVMMPSFKNVFKKGENLYKSSRKHDAIKWFVHQDEFNTDNPISQGKEHWSAYRNLLQLIYYHSFLPAIQRDNRLLVKFIRETKDWNRESAIQFQRRNRGKVNLHAYRYKDMPEYSPGTDLNQYFKELQKQQSLQEDEMDTRKVKKNYYTEFVQDIFVHAFGSYLKDTIGQYYDLLMHPKKIADLQDGSSPEDTLHRLFDKENPIIEMHTNLKADTKYIGMYPFLRLLDARELNKLQHQFIRYRSSAKKREDVDQTVLKQSEEVETLIALVQFTIPPLREDEHYKTVYNEFFSAFIKVDNLDFYKQEDEKSLVQHRSMSLVGRSGAMALYHAMFVKEPDKPLYRITEEEYEEYCKHTLLGEKRDDYIETPIEKNQKKLKELHENLVRIRSKKGYERDLSKYEGLLKEVKTYNDLRRKLTFESLYKVHQIHVDILSRFASFAQDWERDMFFLLTALKSQQLISVDVNYIFKYTPKEGGIVKKISKKFNDCDEEEKMISSLLWSNQGNKNSIRKDFHVRNNVAHLNHMTQFRPFKKITQPNIITLISRLRTLLAYDTKRQNAVTKAVIEILEKHGIELSLARPLDRKNDNEFEIRNLKSTQIKHLKNLEKPVTINASSELECKLVKQLLLFQYKEN